MLQHFLVHNGESDDFLKAVVLLTFACLLWNQSRTPCLNCRKPLGMGALWWWVSGGPRPSDSPRCPNCRVSIDRDFPDRPAR